MAYWNDDENKLRLPLTPLDDFVESMEQSVEHGILSERMALAQIFYHARKLKEEGQ